MIFKVNEWKNTLEVVNSSNSIWHPKERQIEELLLSGVDEQEPVLESPIFGEDFLIVRNQVATKQRKIADVLAIDKLGNGVVIELKRDLGRLGVETQALQYLADFSIYKGKDFIRQFSQYSPSLEDNLKSFLDDGRIEDVNRQSRIILVARYFDTAIFSMGEWLSNKGVAFRCIQYEPIEISGERYLNFSVAFDRSPEFLYPLSFHNRMREPGYFWHNIGFAEDNWWAHLVQASQISAGFGNDREGPGKQLLGSYIPGDIIIAYAKGYGAVAWGIIDERKNAYRFLQTSEIADRFAGKHQHRLSIKWEAVASRLEDGIRPDILKDNFGVFHPLRTSVKIDSEKAKRLIRELNNLFLK
jgi:hypothetical protein